MPDENYFFIKGDRGKIVRIDIPEIFFIEGSQNYITIYKKDEKYITYLTLKEIEKALPADSFIRIHKSFIVNRHKIKVVENSHITLDNKVEITLGSSYKVSFLNALESKVVKSGRAGS